MIKDSYVNEHCKSECCKLFKDNRKIGIHVFKKKIVLFFIKINLMYSSLESLIIGKIESEFFNVDKQNIFKVIFYSF